MTDDRRLEHALATARLETTPEFDARVLADMHAAVTAPGRLRPLVGIAAAAGVIACVLLARGAFENGGASPDEGGTVTPPARPAEEVAEGDRPRGGVTGESPGIRLGMPRTGGARETVEQAEIIAKLSIDGELSRHGVSGFTIDAAVLDLIKGSGIAPGARTRLTLATPGLEEIMAPKESGFDVWDPANISPLVAP